MYKTVIAEKETLLPYNLPIRNETSDQTERNRTQAQLNVPHPNAYIAPFENFLEVNSRKPRKNTGRKGGHETEESVLFVGVLRDGVVTRLRQLDQHDAQDEREEGDPLRFQELFLEDEDSEDGRREDLELVGHL